VKCSLLPVTAHLSSAHLTWTEHKTGEQPCAKACLQSLRWSSVYVRASLEFISSALVAM